MPTLVWVYRPKSGTIGAAGVDSARKAEAAAAVPDPVVTAAAAAAAVPDSVHVALPAVSSKRCADAVGGKRKKRKTNSRAKAATVAKKKSKTTSDRDLPRGVHTLSSGKFQSTIWWGNKQHHIGTFGSPEQASAAYMSARKDLDDANISRIGADEKDAIFDAAKKKALESFGGFVPEERYLPTGVRKSSSGKFTTYIKWGGKFRYIGTFDTPEQASAARMSARKDLDDAKLSALGADEKDATFDKARKKAPESLGVFVQAKRDLPRGVKKKPSGKFQSTIRRGGKKRHIGSFDTPEQASAAYMSVKKDLDDANLSALGVDGVQAIFDEAKNNALASFGGFVPEERYLPTGVRKSSSGKFTSYIKWGGKCRYIGAFDTPEQASAVYMSARKDLDDAKLSALVADEAKATFDKARKKALEMVQAMMNSDGLIV